MKKILSILLVAVMISACFIIPGAAVEPKDVRYLESEGQNHIYLGNKSTTAPVVDGTVNANEYGASAPATLVDCPENVIKDVKHYFSYTAEKIYLAVEMTEETCAYNTSAYNFYLGFPTAGGFTDAASGLRVNLVINGENAVTAKVYYVDHHNGARAVSMNMSLFDVVTASAAKRNVTAKKTSYEIEIDIEKLKYESGIIFDDLALFYTSAVSSGSTYYYRHAITEDTAASINAAYPDHAVSSAANFVPHVVHFCEKSTAETANKIETLPTAAIKLYDRATFGIRFTTKIEKAYLDALVAEHGKDNVRVGTLIVTEDKLNEIGGALTLDTVGELTDGVGVNVLANIDAPYASDATSYVFAGGLRTVSDKAADYVAVGYVKAGDTVEYSPVCAERSVSGVAFAALRDLSATQSESYANPVLISNAASSKLSVAEATFTAYSCYSKTDVENLYVLASGYNCARLTYFWDVLPKADGEIRIGCSNVYFHNMKTNIPDGTPAQKREMHARNTASIVEMNADVILLQEVSEGLRTSGGKVLDYRVQTYLYPQLIEAGYTLVDVEVGDFPKGTLDSNFKGINYTPIWYDANTVTLEACGHKFFDSVRTNPDGALSSSKSYTWALFTQKSTGKQFAAISTHYTWHSSAEMGTILRNNDAKEVMAMVAQIEEQYNVPVVVMGDLNSNLSTPAYATMASGNLANGRELADMVVNAAYSSSHTYGASATYMPTFGNPIDHAFASKEGWIMTKHQNHVTDKAIAATDHVPLSMDFILT